MHDITVRRIEFEFPDDIEPVVIAGQPEESYAMIAFSLLLPYFEPYLVARTYSPWYTPENIELSEEMRALARRYSEMAARSRLAAEPAAQDCRSNGLGR